MDFQKRYEIYLKWIFKIRRYGHVDLNLYEGIEFIFFKMKRG